MLLAALAALSILTPAEGTTVTTVTVTVTGTAAPNATVEVLVEGTADGTTTADAAGNWSEPVSLYRVGANVVTATSDGDATSRTVYLRATTSAPDIKPEAPPVYPTTVDVALSTTGRLTVKRSLSPGTYTFNIRDASRRHGLTFNGHATTKRFTGMRRWTFTLTPGTYRLAVTPRGRGATITVR